MPLLAVLQQPAGMGKKGAISREQFLEMQEACIQRVLGHAVVPGPGQTFYEGGKWDGDPVPNEWAVPKGPPARQNPVWPAPYWYESTCHQSSRAFRFP